MVKIGRSLLVCLLCWSEICLAEPVPENVAPIKLGVLAPQGAAVCQARWNPTAAYLSDCLKDHIVKIIPLSYADVYSVVANRQVDFILLNPSLYVEMEARYGISAILTLKNSRSRGGQTLYGGTIFCRDDNHAISTVRDLKGKRFLAVNENSFGGWFAVWREFRDQGINPYRDFKTLEFDSETRTVVDAVRDGHVEAGSVRAGEIERLIAAGDLEDAVLRIIERRHDAGYPFMHSTRLYPEWPLAKMRHTPTDLSKRLSMCLMVLSSDSQAARHGDYSGWITPLNYRSVHECLMDLRRAPYEEHGRVSLPEALRQHWPWVLSTMFLLVLLIVIAFTVLRLNAKLTQTSKRLHAELSERRRMEQERERLIQELQESLAKVKTLSGIIPICSNCKKIRDDRGYWHQVEEYIHEHTDAEFSHGLCRECARKLYPELTSDEK